MKLFTMVLLCMCQTRVKTHTRYLSVHKSLDIASKWAFPPKAKTSGKSKKEINLKFSSVSCCEWHN